MKVRRLFLIVLVMLGGCASTKSTALPSAKYRFVVFDATGKQVGRITVLPDSDQEFIREVLCMNRGAAKVVAYNEAGAEVASYTCISKVEN